MAESLHHITCRELVELVTDYLEGELPTDETELFEQHLNFCAGCQWYVDQMRVTVGAVERSSEDDVPPDTLERLRAAFRDREGS